MKKLALIALFALTAALPLRADDRSQSYFTYEDGGTIVRQGDDGREVDARLNFPLYPGDEVLTSRRGRAEVRLADGNVIGLDRGSDLRFRSILESYDGDASQTIAELRSGHVVVLRMDGAADETFRLDTQSASYAATEEAIFAIDTDTHGRDRVTVFDGGIEIRTPSRTTRVRAGEEANVDDQGIYGLASLSSNTSDDFERWFLHRAERYGHASSRYLDRSLAYSDSDLESNGSWVFVSGFSGWAWRPRVAAGWRPYYYGSWANGPSGCLTWVSDEPWGWVPYHYGRWAYDPVFGWVWLPGTGYAPAWVYWIYGSDYVGWAPSGWWDCYRPYYDWCYRPYAHVNFAFGGGFYGRIRISDLDLRPWTFVSPGVLISNRADRASFRTDAVRERIIRGSIGGFATVGSAPARFTHSEIKDPATAVGVIARRGIGSGTGKEGSGTPADMSAFFRRDPELSSGVRDRIVRSRGTGDGATRTPGFSSGAPASAGTVAGRGADPGSGIVSRDSGWRRGSGGASSAGAGSAASGTINRGTIGRGDGSSAGAATAESGRVLRRGDGNGQTGGQTNGQTGGQTNQPDHATTPGATTPNWRDRVERPSSPSIDRPVTGSTPSSQQPRDDSWRGRVAGRGDAGNANSGNKTPAAGDGTSAAPSGDHGSEIPRRIIDHIGGPRVYPDNGSTSGRHRDPASGSPQPAAGSANSGSASSGTTSSGNSGSSSGSSSGSNSSGGRSRSSSSGSSSSGSSSSGHSSGSSSGSSGHSSSGSSSHSSGSSSGSSSSHSSGSSSSGSSSGSHSGGDKHHR